MNKHPQLKPFLTPTESLPAQAYHPNHHAHERLPEKKNGPNTVNTLQHVLRAAITSGMTSSSELDSLIHATGRYEREHLFPDLDTFEDEVMNLDQFVCDQTLGHTSAIRESLEQRERWYDALVNGEYGQSFADVLERGEKLHDSNGSLELVCVTPGSDHPSEHGVEDVCDSWVAENELCRSPVEFGYSLPHVFLGFKNPSTDDAKIKPFVPWFGTVVCLCGGKQNIPYLPDCKHEIAVLLSLANGGLSPKFKSALPLEYRQFVHPFGRRVLRNVVDYSDTLSF